MEKLYVLRAYWKSALFLFLFNFCVQYFSFGQGIEFNNRINIQNRSIILRNIIMDGDSLLISGEIGRDSLGLSGFFLLYADSLGHLGIIKNYRDPSLQDHTLLDGRNPVLINANNQVVLAGHYLEQDDAFFMILNKQLDTIAYNDFASNYRSMVVHGILEINHEYYVVGMVQTQNFDLDVFLQKIDSTGKKIWEKTFGVPSKDETGRAAIIENNGLTIMVSESFDNTPTTKNDTRYWIRFMHLDTSGAITRDWREEVTGQEGWSGSLVKFKDDYIYSTNFLGEEYGFGYFQAGQVVRRDQDFNLVWRRPYGAPDNYFNGLGDMIISADSNLLLTGQILDESQTYVLQRVLKICPDGDVFWELRDTGLILNNGESLNFMEGIAASSCHSIYAVGYTYKSPGFYEGLILKVSGDGCIDTLCTTTDIENFIRLKEKRILLFPNPARSELHIAVSEAVPLPILVLLYDMHGRLFMSTWINQYETSLDISGLPDGIYHIMVEKNGMIILADTMVKMQ